MTYASAFERDVFISYCHTDNENPLGDGWIDLFHSLLALRMKQILGARTPKEEASIWRDKRLQGNDEFADVLYEELKKVALVVSVMSPSYVRSEWCVREVDAFCRAAALSGGLTVGHKARIFKILKTPVERAKHPAPLQGQTGYEFYVVDPDTHVPREFTLTRGDDHTARALEIVNDLAYHIKATLDAINAVPPQAANDAAVAPLPVAPATGRCVFLAETSFQLDEQRCQIRRELETRGMRVLPEGDLPVRHPEQFRQAVQAALAQCELSVHLVAPTRSLVLPGELQDTVYLQNQLAAGASARSALKRLIWIPEGLTAREDDPRQQGFIEQLHNDPAAQQNAEVLTAPLQSLIARIHDTLRKLDEPKKKPAETAASAPPRIYLVTHPKDVETAEPLRAHLFDSGCEVLEPLTDPNASELELFEAHKMNLVDCDAVLVYWGEAGEFWARSQISDSQKAIGWREGRPLVRAVYLAPADTPPKQRLRSNDYLVLDGRAGFDPRSLAPLLEALGAVAARSAA